MTMNRIGRVAQLVRYPVKSMAGVPAESAMLGFHGIDGDRRFAFRRIGDESGFPWLSASRLPELLLYQPIMPQGDALPTHVRTPDGATLELRDPELRKAIAERLGADVELMQLKHGIFDDAAVSVISEQTIAEISSNAGMAVDTRRFRANVLVTLDEPGAFQEDGWVGGTLLFGDEAVKPAIAVTARDVRCTMISLDPDTAERDDRLLRSVVRLNRNNAGVYATVIQSGVIRVGDAVTFAAGNAPPPSA